MWCNMIHSDLYFFIPQTALPKKHILHLLMEMFYGKSLLDRLFYTPSLHELHHKYVNMIDDKKDEITL